MINILKALGTVLLIVLATVFTIAILYVSMWLTVGIFIVGLVAFILSALQAKDKL